MMDAKASAVSLPGHGTTADGMLQAASQAIPGARPKRISFWDDKRPVPVQMRFPEDHTPAGRSNVTLDLLTGKVLTAVSSRSAPVVYTALGAMEPRDPHRHHVRPAVAHRGVGL
jgi:hypothetical protein